jgi:hypothetical protein
MLRSWTRTGYSGEAIAARFDGATSDESEAGTIDATVDLLARLAGEGPALELAVGTGRLGEPFTTGRLGEPFTEESRSHVSAWERVAGPWRSRDARSCWHVTGSAT